ncbi:MAG: family 43 glycosylhydrolase, partial [Asticcacaulis sp.]
IFRDGDYYYRFTKVTDAEGCPSADIMAQRSKSLRATTESGAWTVVDRCIGRRAGTPEVEGPSAFIANPNDTSGFKYYVWVDHYRGIGYIPLGTNSLETPIEWTYPADFRLPKRPRHGSVLPITARERAALVDRWGIVTPEVPASSSPQAQLMDNWVVPPVVASGTRLPVPQGHEVRWAVEGAKIVDGLLINDQGAPVSVSLTGTLTLPQGDTLTKTFAVQVLGRDGQMLAAYARTPTTVREANQPSVARSLHLALGQNAADLEPLHGNYGVLFASGDYTDVDRVALRGLSDPSLFYFADGSLGVIATRVDMSGAPEATQPSHTLIFKADPKSPADFTELGLIDLRTEGAVVAPKAVWDSASKRYVVSWRDATGAAHWTTVEDMARTELRGSPYQPENRGRRTRIATEGNVGKPHSGDVATIDTALAAATGDERANGLPISAEIASALTHRFGRIVNTAARVEPVNIAAGDVTTLANVRAQLDYSDGSTATRGVDWNASDLKRLAKARSGTHEIRGTVRQPAYPQIFAYNRADPAIHRYERDGVVKYLFIATDDTNNNNVGSPHLPLRVADSLAGLADDNGGLAREVDLLNRVTRRDRTREGRVIAGCYWAPELHEIGGRLSILFAPCFNPNDDQANEKGSWSTVEAHIMQLRDGGDPANPADWSQPAAVRKADGTALGRAEFDRNISLDMSYFEANGQHYYTWSQRYISDPETMGDPLTWIARVDPSAPTRLVTEPQLIIAPSLSFEENLAEGAFAVFHNDRIHLVYSGSKVSPTYVVGGVWARTDSNLTNIDSWHKWKAPLQKSVPMPEGVNDYLTYEQGAGHGAFTTDEDGNTLYVYHSWGNGVGGNGRDTRVRRLHWAADGRPVLYMTPDEEVVPENRAVTTKVTIQ